jgi:hypothetical protein
MLHHGELSVAHALSRAESDFCVKEDEWMVATS